MNPSLLRHFFISRDFLHLAKKLEIDEWANSVQEYFFELKLKRGLIILTSESLERWQFFCLFDKMKTWKIVTLAWLAFLKDLNECLAKISFTFKALLPQSIATCVFHIAACFLWAYTDLTIYHEIKNATWCQNRMGKRMCKRAFKTCSALPKLQSFSFLFIALAFLNYFFRYFFCKPIWPFLSLPHKPKVGALLAHFVDDVFHLRN